MNNLTINYTWLIFGKNIIDLAKDFKEKKEDCKNLSIMQIIQEKLKLHDFIKNSIQDNDNLKSEIEKFKKQNIKFKDLKNEEILEMSEFHNFIKNHESINYLYLQNLISDSLKQNSVPHQVFLKTYTADEIDYVKELGLDSSKTNREAKEFFDLEILNLFSQEGKFQKELDEFFNKIKNKNNNIKFISINQAQKEILNKIGNIISDEKEIQDFKENMIKMSDSFYEVKEFIKYTKENAGSIFSENEKGEKINSYEIEIKSSALCTEKRFNNFFEFLNFYKNNQDKFNDEQNTIIKTILSDKDSINLRKIDFTINDLILDSLVFVCNKKDSDMQSSIQRGFMIDFSKFISALYTNLFQEKDAIITDFDTKQENLDSKLYEKNNLIKFSFISRLSNFIFLKKNYPNSKFTQILEIFAKDGIFDNYGNFSHAGLFFVPKSFINYSLFFVKNAFQFSENPFFIPKEETINKNFTLFFGQNFEWIMDDFFDFFIKNKDEYLKNDNFSQENYFVFEDKFKKFIKEKYILNEFIDLKCGGFKKDHIKKITIKSFENYFDESKHNFEMHIKRNNSVDRGFVQGRMGDSWEKNQDFKEINIDIELFLKKYIKMYNLVLDNVSPLSLKEKAF
jgi:hypothetical protein